MQRECEDCHFLPHDSPHFECALLSGNSLFFSFSPLPPLLDILLEKCASLCVCDFQIGNPEVIRFAAAALTNMIGDSSEAREAVLECGIIKDMVDRLKIHRGNIATVAQIFRSLWTGIKREERSQKEFGACGGYEILSSIMDDQINNAPVVCEAILLLEHSVESKFLVPYNFQFQMAQFPKNPKQSVWRIERNQPSSAISRFCQEFLLRTHNDHTSMTMGKMPWR